jgi:cytochrome c biogenesis protein CcdA
MIASVLALASQANDVTSGAVLTLVLPLGLLLVAVAVWYWGFRRSDRKPGSD